MSITDTERLESLRAAVDTFEKSLSGLLTDASSESEREFSDDYRAGAADGRVVALHSVSCAFARAGLTLINA